MGFLAVRQGSLKLQHTDKYTIRVGISVHTASNPHIHTHNQSIIKLVQDFLQMCNYPLTDGQ